MEKVEFNPLDRLCRVCLLECKESHPIFAELPKESNIYSLLTKIVDIQLSKSEVPNVVCDNCFQFLFKLRKFQELCLKSDKIIREYYSEQQKPLEAKDVNLYEVKIEAVEVNVDVHESLGVTSEGENTVETNFSDDSLTNDGVKKEKPSFADYFSENNVEYDAGENNNSSLSGADNIKKKFSYYLQTNESGVEVYSCNICPEKYTKRKDFKDHLFSHGDYPFVCNQCKKGFRTHQSLFCHSKRHTITVRYKCELCDKSYIEKASLKVHMRVHRGEKPFLCSTCGKAFRSNSELKTHLVTHSGEKKFMCNYCGARLRTRSSFNVHLRSHTGERPFLCTECPKTFTSTNQLRMHKITHTNLKPYSCSICQKSFNRRFTLRVHVKSHSKERPHICTVCDKRFTQAHSLRSHLRIHNREKNESTIPINIDESI